MRRKRRRRRSYKKKWEMDAEIEKRLQLERLAIGKKLNGLRADGVRPPIGARRSWKEGKRTTRKRIGQRRASRQLDSQGS